MSQSEPTLQELCQRLDAANRSERREIAPRLHRYVLEDPNRWTHISDGVVETLVEHLDAPDSTVRCAALFVLGHVGANGEEWCEFSGETYTRSDVVEGILDAFDDDCASVRQTAARPGHLSDVAEGVLSGEVDVPTTRLVSQLFDGLHDSTPVVRKRVADVFEAHGSDLIAAHPEPQQAVASLVAALGDPVDAFGVYQNPARTPRWAALDALREGLDEYDPQVLVEDVATVTTLLEDDQLQVRMGATYLLAELYDRDELALDQFADDVLAAMDEGLYPKWWEPYDRLALTVGLEYPESVETVYAHFRSAVTAENTKKDRWTADDSVLLALSRLIRASDASFDQPLETLAETVAWDTTVSDDTDPLVLLASPHPEFVASQLRDGYRAFVAGEWDENRRFYRDLVVEVADENPAAIDGVPEILADEISKSHVRKALSGLVEAHPQHAAGVVPGAFDRADWEVPMGRWYSELIEATAGYWTEVPDWLVDILIDTVAIPEERYASKRRYAIRALVALHEEGLQVLPDGFEPFVELYHAGRFDDEAETDPLETGAAEAAGLSSPSERVADWSHSFGCGLTDG